METTPAVTTTPAPEAPFATKEAYLAILAQANIPVDDQSGFIKVLLPGGRLYVANTKTVRRIDLAEFEVGLGTLTKTPKKPNGKVMQEAILGRGATKDLETFTAILTHLQSLPAIEKAKPAPKVKAPKAAKDAAPAKPAPLSPEDMEARKALIAKVAKEKGVAVSSKSIAFEAPPSSPEELVSEEPAIAEALEAAEEAGVVLTAAAE